MKNCNTCGDKFDGKCTYCNGSGQNSSGEECVWCGSCGVDHKPEPIGHGEKLPRVLITGSRKWHDGNKVVNILKEQHTLLGEFILISGACPTGADHIAEEWAKCNNIKVERFPADWKQYGKRAAYIRNQAMVDSGITVCLAFPLGESIGTRMTINLAQKANIPTLIFEQLDHLN